jgi:hypothetical protein
VLTGRHAHLASQPLPAQFPANTLVHADLSAFVDHLLAEVTAAGVPA